MVKLSIAGLGVMGTRFYNLANEMGIDVVAVCDIDENKIDVFKSRVAKVYKDYRDMADEGGFDGVIIAVPPRYHVEQAIEFLKRGYYVLLEKPMAHDLEGARKIFEVAKGRNRLFVGYCLRFNKLYKEIKSILDEKIGNPRFLWHIALGRFPQRSWIENKSISGGILNEHGSHVIYVFYWYAGDVKKIYANMVYDDREIEKQFTVILEHRSGVTSVFSLSWFGGHLWRKWGIDCERGRVVVEGYLEGEYVVSSRNGTILERKTISEDSVNMYREELRHFIDVMERNDRFLVNEEDAFTISRIIDAAYRSAKEGKEIYL